MKNTLFSSAIFAILLLFSQTSLALNSNDQKLLDAAKSGNVQEVKRLLDRGADPNAESKDCDNTPLINASHQSSFEIYRLLIEARAEVNQTNSCNNWTPLMGAISYKAPFSAIKLLVDKGAHLSFKSGDGWTPLRIALRQEDGRRMNAAQMLLEAGAAADWIDDSGYTYLMRAIQNTKTKTSVEVVRTLIDKGADVHVTTEEGWNALLFNARHMGSAEVMTMLKNKGVDIYSVSSKGWNAMHLIARYGADYDSEIDRFILDNDFPLNKRTNGSWTPLMLTVYGDNPRFAKLLIENGADLNIKYEDKTAYDRARDENKSAVLAVFETSKRNEQIAKRVARDSKLPTAVRKDKYMIALTENLKQEKYQESLLYFELLEQLQVELSSSFYYFWGEALYNTGEAEPALEKLYAYINNTGTDGQYYTQALALSNKAEELL